MKSQLSCVSLLGVLIVALAASYCPAAPPDKAGQAVPDTQKPSSPAPEPRDAQLPQSLAEWEVEVLAAVTQARRLLPRQPAAAETILEAARERVASSGLAPAEKWRLERRIDATAGYARQLREMQQNNQAIRDRVQFERQSRVEIDQIISDEADHFDQLLRAGRFAEAEALAFDLWNLSPGNPAVEAMIGKLRFAPYRFDLSFGALYPYSYVDPFAFDYYPYTVPWRNYRERVYIGPYLHPEGGRYGGEPAARSQPLPQPAPREPDAESSGEELDASARPRSAPSSAADSI